MASEPVACHLLRGYLPADRIVATGYRLWTADTLGVAIFLPATLALVARPRADWRPLLLTAALPMLLVGLAIAAAMTRQEMAAVGASRQDFDRKSIEAAHGFMEQIEEVQLILDDG